MIAHVYPIKKLPRKFDHFDYKIPTQMKVKRGDVVEIPFKNKSLLGIVKSIHDTQERGIKLKTISSIVKTFYLREDELSFFEWMSNEIAQSVPSILYAALPTPPKHNQIKSNYVHPEIITIPKSEINQISSTVTEISRRRTAFITISDLRRTSAIIAGFIQKNPDQKCLLITPTVHDAKLLNKYLHNLTDTILTGAQKNNERFSTWQKFKKQKNGLLIGTKIALLHIDSSISTIFIYRSGHKNHKNFDRNPRYDARKLAKYISDNMKTNLYHLDVMPRIDDINTFSKINLIGYFPSMEIDIINLTSEQTASPHPIISYSVTKAIEKTISSGKNVMCVYNKKGFALRLKCTDCGHAFCCKKCNTVLKTSDNTVTCPRCIEITPIPTNCEKCDSKNILEKGIGNKRLALIFKKIFPNLSIGIIDKENPKQKKANILLVTNYYLENLNNPFRKSNIGLVVQIDADTPLFEASFRAVENTLLNTEQWRGVAKSFNARFIIQTESLDLFNDFYNDKLSVLNKEMETRKLYNHPPFKRWISITYSDEEKLKLELQADVLIKKINTISDKIKVNGPVKIDETTWKIDIITTDNNKQVLQMLKTLSDQYIIDTNAFSY